MKKQICAIAMAAAFSMPATADFLGVYAGIDYHTTENKFSDADFKDSNNLSGYVAFEHFIPLIPNAKIKYSDLDSDGDTVGLDAASSSLNGILYYELFDNGLFEIDLGAAYSRLENVRGKSADILQGYGAAKVHIPGMNMYAFTEVTAGSASSDDATDAELGLAYTFNPDSLLLSMTVRAGYRTQEMTINRLTQENNGVFAGLEAHF